MRKLIRVLLGATLVAVASSAAASVSVAGNGWVGDSPTDDAFIDHTDGKVYNMDTAANHNVVAAFQQTVNDQTPTLTVYVKSNNLGLTCFLQSRNLETGSFSTAVGLETGDTYTTMAMSLSLPFGPVYAHSGYCALPKKNGSAFAYIYGATLT